ncbi:hypothetical protein FZEAL_2765 [Fusarium zealandicum]|uniref:Uncharacterized protein n=1 Tax=Fusarium zealandicum TaxID=1053134 RepID=A0A8H4UQ13_9HYPO|nr:hypothetical protein FZEAL_2765 [Fusarium zealandicum]
MDLPQLHLQEAPIRHPNCCLSLSLDLLRLLTQSFSKSALSGQTPTVLSIGSGSGLLEALLLAHVQSQSHSESRDDALADCLNVEGVEVQQSSGKDPVNRYLPEQAIYTVRGTWDVVSRLHDPDVTGLMFVYPRQPTLVSAYIEAITERDPNIEVVVWLGPMADWEVFAPCLEINGKHQKALFTIYEKRQGMEAGLDEYEMMVVLRRYNHDIKNAST